MDGTTNTKLHRIPGRVTDFIYLAAGPVHTGVFNVADMAITSDVIWLVISSFAPKKG
jgi:lipoprotein signal peptidase